jgi:hypothetical protein
LLEWWKQHGIAGRVLTLGEATELGAMEWRPLIEQTTPGACGGSPHMSKSLPAESR